MTIYARVIVDVPIAQPLDYVAQRTPEIGSLVVVPVGKRRQMGIVVGAGEHSVVEQARLRPLGACIPGLNLPANWLELCRFAADYYHYPWGEVALPALPPMLRKIPVARRGKKRDGAQDESVTGAFVQAACGQAQLLPCATSAAGVPGPELRQEQRQAIEAISSATGFAPFVLFGVTGSGKTEVYLCAIERALAGRAGAQALLLVPEINLTPQLHARLCARLPQYCVISLHSGLAPRERALAWMQAHEGKAQIVLGTRTAVFASLPGLALLIVDEEHDASFKSHGGVPFSARDLAVKRAQIEAIPVVLGSATPSLETWHLAQSGRYRMLCLAQRAGEGAGQTEPRIETIDLKTEPADQGLAAPLRLALEQTLERGEQALVFLNRRGFAPVLRCAACEWLSRCPRCDVFAAYHKVGGALRCHHCGWNRRVPGACPDCGNLDLQGVGQGTQRVEETLRRLWPQARIARIDRDNTARGAGGAGAAFDAVHAGEIDILVGTQMITKGHDFRRVSTVGVLNADAQLVAVDFRAPERLFAVLMQVAGRAGRAGQASRVLIQTRYPQHPLFAALARQNFRAFAQEQVEERREARMPPFVHHALLTCAARSLEPALDFLQRCVQLRLDASQLAPVTLFDPVPMPLARLAAESRAQLLVEAQRRADLHEFLNGWLPRVRAMGNRGVLRWAIEVDPQSI